MFKRVFAIFAVLLFSLASASFAAEPEKPKITLTASLSTSSIKFQWEDKSTNEDDFHVERKPDGGTFSELATVVSTTKTTTGTFYSFTDSGLSCDSEYWYRVLAHRHSDNAFSYSSQGGNNETTLYWITDSVADLTPDFAAQDSSDVPLMSFKMTSCKSGAEIRKVTVEYTGDDKDDIDLMKLYQESGVGVGFDPSTDTLLTTEAPPGGGSNEFNLGPPNVAVGIGSVTFYVVVDLSSTVGNAVDAKIKKDKIDIFPNNPDGASESNWPLAADEATWDPAGFTTIVAPDSTPPTGSWKNPTADTDVSGVVSLEVSASDTGSGVKEVKFQYKRNDGVDTFHTIATDDTNVYSTDWDTTGLALDEYTLRAVLTDNVGNFVNLDIEVDVAAVVSSESSTTPSTDSAVITWTTDRPTSSRVIYDTVSHPALGDPPNYGYAFSTGTSDTDPKVTSHSVTITGLSSGTIYYYRTVSEGSPTAVGEEKGFQTLTQAGPGGGGGAGAPAPTPALVLAAATTFGAVGIGGAVAGATEEEEVLGEEAPPAPPPTAAPGLLSQLLSSPQVWAALGIFSLLILAFLFFARKRT